MNKLQQRFLSTFKSAIQMEMDAMREQLGPFEVLLADGRLLSEKREQEPYDYRFDLPFPDQKLNTGLECSLRDDDGPADSRDLLVTILSVDTRGVSIRTSRKIEPETLRRCRLVIYPWFIYERLLQALESVLGEQGDPSLCIEQAMRLFGKIEGRVRTCEAVLGHDSLNRGQVAAIDLALRRNPAFIWGPPGTGKTTVLCALVADLLAQGRRVLITSTTNAAVDQALAQLALMPGISRHIEDGVIVRVGRTESPTFGTGLREILERKMSVVTEQRDELLEQAAEARELLEVARELSGSLGDNGDTGQLGLFEEEQRPEIDAVRMSRLFDQGRCRELISTFTNHPGDLEHALDERIAELTETIDSAEQEAGRHRSTVSETKILGGARCILTTMANLYVNQALTEERFDTVIIEEAGMAILPAVFYCAALSTDSVIAVGDPRQLPPIVQSNSDFVRRAMGRSIFEVACPDPFTSPAVALLTRQYRMHPVIGDLVSRLYYRGALEHATTGSGVENLVMRPPFPEHPVVVIDTQGIGVTRRAEGSWSRYNEETARICSVLAQAAAAQTTTEEGRSTVAVITPYAEQSRRFRRILESPFVECSTVHRFQGNERDVVILDMTDGPPLQPGRLLTDRQGGAEKLLNVSISRAKHKLIVLADLVYFRSEAPESPADRLLKEAARCGTVVSASELMQPDGTVSVEP